MIPHRAHSWKGLQPLQPLGFSLRSGLGFLIYSPSRNLALRTPNQSQKRKAWQNCKAYRQRSVSDKTSKLPKTARTLSFPMPKRCRCQAHLNYSPVVTYSPLPSFTHAFAFYLLKTKTPKSQGQLQILQSNDPKPQTPGTPNSGLRGFGLADLAAAGRVCCNGAVAPFAGTRSKDS